MIHEVLLRKGLRGSAGLETTAKKAYYLNPV